MVVHSPPPLITNGGRVLEINGAFVKSYTSKVGKNVTKIKILAPLPATLARELRVHSLVFTTENMPKPELIEVKLNVKKSAPFELRLEVQNVPHVLNMTCEDAIDWIARQQGTSKKGKPSRLLIEFSVVYVGSILGLVEWLERYGQAAGTLSMQSTAPQQATLLDTTPKKAQKKKNGGKAKAAAAEEAQPATETVQ